MSVALAKPQAIAKHEGIEQVEAGMLNLPQVDCPVAHHFGPGIYIREVTVPKGTFVVTNAQRFDHINILLQGKALIQRGNEQVLLEAPLFFIGPPGRKMGMALETIVWQNVYATEETDIDKLEEMFFDKSDTWQSHNKDVLAAQSVDRSVDREDYAKVIAEMGFSEQEARAVSENVDDQIPMPHAWATVAAVRNSVIEGKGMFMSWPVVAGTIIAPARINELRTPAGRYVNHAKDPNCRMVKDGSGDIYLVSIRDISGCKGGDAGEELTVDYRQAVECNLLRSTECQE